MWNKQWSDDEVAYFSQRLLYLLEAGLPILKAFSILSGTFNKSRKQTIVTISDYLQRGYSLSASLEKIPFPSFYCFLIGSAELHGQLTDTLSILHTFYERRHIQKARLRKALTYPIFVFLSSIGSLFVILQLLMPQFYSLYQTFQVELPWFSRMMMDLWQGWQRYQQWMYILIILVFGVLFLLFKRKRQLFDQMLLFLPIYSSFLRLKLTYVVSMQLGLLLEGGVHILEICQLFHADQKGTLLPLAFRTIETELNNGKSLSMAFHNLPCFLPVLQDVLRIAEESGTLGSALKRMAEQLGGELERSTARLASAAEVLLMVGMGGLILLVMLSLFVPLFSLINQI